MTKPTEFTPAMPAQPRVRRVYLHIGLSKSGTTYLQQWLWSNRDLLRERGILYPGADPTFQHRAVWDLLGRRMRGGHQRDIPGAWGRLAEEVTSWTGPTAVISEEFLVHARARHLRRIARDFAGHELHVVLTVRDLERTVASMWQHELMIGHTWSLPEYLAAVREPDSGGTAGARFWLRFDLDRILATWSAIAPADHIHVVIVPGPGAPSDVLAARFGAAIGIDLHGLTLPAAPVNTSLGAADAEVLRRVNVCLAGRLTERERHHVIERLLRPSLTGSRLPIRVPDEDLAWIKPRAAAQADRLMNSPYHVVGDIADLVPRDRTPVDNAEAVDEAAVMECAITALVAVTLRFVRLLRARRAGPVTPRAPSVTTMASWARAQLTSLGLTVLDAADHNRAASKATALYLRRLTGRG